MDAVLQPGATALHHQLYLVLRDKISRGEIRPGAPLASEYMLGERYGVSRITVRRALQELVDAGLIERRQGRGTFVRDRGGDGSDWPSLTLEEVLQKAHHDTRVRVVEVAHRPPPAEVASALAVDLDVDRLYVLRVRSAGPRPVIVSEAWLPSALADVVTRQALAQQPLYLLVRSAGVGTGRVTQELSAERADPRHAALLDTDVGAPLIRITRLVHDSDGQPHHFLRHHLSPERSRILMDIPADAVDTVPTGVITHDVEG